MNINWIGSYFVQLYVYAYIYRVSTKELYTFKMLHKTNAVYLELHTYTSRQKNIQSFVSNDPGDCSCAPPQDATRF
jgi:hypothetical protein